MRAPTKPMNCPVTRTSTRMRWSTMKPAVGGVWRGPAGRVGGAGANHSLGRKEEHTLEHDGKIVVEPEVQPGGGAGVRGGEHRERRDGHGQHRPAVGDGGRGARQAEGVEEGRAGPGTGRAASGARAVWHRRADTALNST